MFTSILSPGGSAAESSRVSVGADPISFALYSAAPLPHGVKFPVYVETIENYAPALLGYLSRENQVITVSVHGDVFVRRPDLRELSGNLLPSFDSGEWDAKSGLEWTVGPSGATISPIGEEEDLDAEISQVLPAGTQCIIQYTIAENDGVEHLSAWFSDEDVTLPTGIGNHTVEHTLGVEKDLLRLSCPAGLSGTSLKISAIQLKAKVVSSTVGVCYSGTPEASSGA